MEERLEKQAQQPSVLEQRVTQENNDLDFKAKIFLPKNDNLVPILSMNIGPYLFDRFTCMRDSKILREKLGYSNKEGKISRVIEVHLARAEDIAGTIIDEAQPNSIGVSGSDLALARILDKERKNHFYRMRNGNNRTRGIWKRAYKTGELYTDTINLIGEDLQAGSTWIFESKDKVVRMRVLGNYEEPPYLCILGPDDKKEDDKKKILEEPYEELIKRRRAEGKPIKVVCEGRYFPLAKNHMEVERARLEFEYELRSLTGSTEGFVRKGGEEERPDVADITIEIGRTFGTAKANRLMVYRIITKTCPVEIVCYPPGGEGEVVSLEKLKDDTQKYGSLYKVIEDKITENS